MKRLVSLLFVLLFFISVLKPVIYCVEFVVNYQYISQVLCINKKKPQLKCNGKCYLKSKLSKVNKTSKSNKRRLLKIYSEKFPIIYNRIAHNTIVPKIGNNKPIFRGAYRFSLKQYSITPPTPPPQC